MPELDHDYTYRDIAALYKQNHPVLHWTVIHGSRIRALRLRKDYNPRIFDSRAQVWVGGDSPTKEWGNTLANDTVEVPLFVKKLKRGKYTYLGIYEVLSDEATAAELAEARKKVPHNRGVSRVVFLKKK
ncbi:MAG TPA: hypothetical protein P5205_19555 [Candidatus Paceibacterota bacterium]|nr:hypothetical protein [Verrucomicrobiota bacterium]HSA12562.1 hypothetical protein [Candidatus Paceibacterota bacterium]